MDDPSACPYLYTDYQTSYRSLPKLVLHGWSVSRINCANHLTYVKLGLRFCRNCIDFKISIFLMGEWIKLSESYITDCWGKPPFLFHARWSDSLRLLGFKPVKCSKQESKRLCTTQCGRCGGLGALLSRSSGTGSSCSWRHCVVFLGKTLNSPSAFLHLQ